MGGGGGGGGGGKAARERGAEEIVKPIQVYILVNTTLVNGSKPTEG